MSEQISEDDKMEQRFRVVDAVLAHPFLQEQNERWEITPYSFSELGEYRFDDTRSLYWLVTVGDENSYHQQFLVLFNDKELLVRPVSSINRHLEWAMQQWKEARVRKE